MRACRNLGDRIGKSGICVPARKRITYSRRIEEGYIIAFNSKRACVTAIVCTAVKLIGDIISNNIPFSINLYVFIRSCRNLSNRVGESGIRVPTTEGITCSRRIEECYIIAFNGKRACVTTVVRTTVEFISDIISVDIPLCIKRNLRTFNISKVAYALRVGVRSSCTIRIGRPTCKCVACTCKCIGNESVCNTIRKVLVSHCAATTISIEYYSVGDCFPMSIESGITRFIPSSCTRKVRIIVLGAAT